jgi:A/G-specific adenine glycosylase
VGDLSKNGILAFRRKILRFYKKYGRKLPFRETTDPYKIAVAEIMLQQTQVERVVEKYNSWIAKWPDWKSLSKATSRQLLAAWSGLGYNRRAIYLGRMAREIVENFDGRLPEDPKQLMTLAGIGPYTANAILIFAFNKPLTAIDTNIRRVIIFEFGLQPDISPVQLESIARQLLPRRSSRRWHNALMDYSRIVLPKQLSSAPPLSRQTKFKGSIRQIRGAIIKKLTVQNRVSLALLSRELGRSPEDIHQAAIGLQKDGMVVVTRSFIRLK